MRIPCPSTCFRDSLLGCDPRGFPGGCGGRGRGGSHAHRDRGPRALASHGDLTLQWWLFLDRIILLGAWSPHPSTAPMTNGTVPLRAPNASLLHVVKCPLIWGVPAVPPREDETPSSAPHTAWLCTVTSSFLTCSKSSGGTF